MANDTRGQYGHIGRVTRLQEILELRGVSPAQLARDAKVDPSTVGKLVRGERELRRHWAERFAPALNVRPDDLLASVGAPLIAAPTAPTEIRPAPDVKVPALATLPRDLPVYGTAAGSNGDGAFLFSQQDVVDYVRRPAGLAGNRKAYGVYVEGDSMHPAYKQGDLIIADPARKPRPGDGVVIVCAAGENDADGHTAFVKEFVKQSPTHLVVKQYNPEKELTFDRARVASVHRILTTAELMGV